MNNESTHFLRSRSYNKEGFTHLNSILKVYDHYTGYPAVIITTFKLLRQILTETEEALFLLIVFGRWSARVH